MKVLLISSDYIPNPLWGMGWHVDQLFNALRKEKIDVYVASANKSKHAHDFMITTNEAEDKDGLSPNKYEIFNNYEKFNEWQIKLAKRIISTGIKFDVIHCHNWMSWLTAKEVKKYIPGAKIVITFHFLQKQYESMVDNPIPSFHREIIEMEMDAIKNADAVIVLSDSQDRLIRENYLNIADKLHLVPHSINFESKEYNLLDEKKNENPIREIVFVGRVENDKGIIETIEAFNRIKNYANIRLNIIGDGPLLKDLKDKNQHSNILFHGYLNRDNLEAILIKSHIFCMPSTSENLPLTVLEAMFFGLVPIFSKGKTVPNIFENGKEGLTVDLYMEDETYKPQVEDIKNAMEELIKNPDYRKELSKQAYKRAIEGYSSLAMMNLIKRVYK